jgi:UDP-glucuronate 4-epimerase
MTEPRRALVTGSAGFIGFHVCRRLLDEGWQVTGLDAMTDYYDVALKRRRLAMLNQSPGFGAVEDRLETPGRLAGLMSEGVDVVVHLAAQAGVRYSIENPASYVASNLEGTFALLEAARGAPPAHLLLASTSSVYGAGTEMPYREEMPVGRPMSFYAATKAAN